MNANMLTRRGLLASTLTAAAALALPAAGEKMPAEWKEPLTDEYDQLHLILEDNFLLVSREDDEKDIRETRVSGPLWKHFSDGLFVIVPADLGLSRAGLIGELERLTAILKQPVPLVDRQGDAEGLLPASWVRLKPGSAIVTGQEFER
jgi:hypothetical protein